MSYTRWIYATCCGDSVVNNKVTMFVKCGGAEMDEIINIFFYFLF